MPPVMDDIEDEDALEKMLAATSEFEERKKIRARLREVRKKKRDEQDKKIAKQQQDIQADTLRNQEDTKAARLKAFDKYPPLKPKDTTVALNNNTQLTNKNTTVENKDGNTTTTTTTSVKEGPGSKEVTTTMYSKSEDKDSKSEHFKQESFAVQKHETPNSSSFSSKSSSVSSSVTSSSTGTPTAPPARKLSKFEQDMEEKRKLREMKRADEEKNWKEYMAKKKQEDMERKKKEMEATKKKKDALMNKFGGKADESGGFGKGTGMSAVPNASTIKQKLLEWCQRCAKGYPEVQITNFSSSWADGMAFCAIVHHYFPNSFDFDSLDKKNRRKNFDLAFETAEKQADIMPLLETDDMIMMKNKPDWKCVFTYVQSLYRHLSKIK